MRSWWTWLALVLAIAVLLAYAATLIVLALVDG